ncbi:hypothetical protein D3C81_1678540 [compost metagenome]
MGPESFVQVIPRQRTTEVAEQAMRQAVFAFGHDDRFAVASDSQFGVVEHQIIEAQPFRRRALLAMSAQDCGNTGFQFIGAERFADVVIGAGIQGLNDIAFAVTTGEHDCRRRCFHVFAGPEQQ